MEASSDKHLLEAKSLRDRILRGQSNELPVQAWAAVCRACAKATDAFRRENAGCAAYGRRHHVWLNNLDAIWWAAKAQVETLARKSSQAA